MPPRSSSAPNVELELDTEALRYLVSRRQIAQVLWHGEVRKALKDALEDVHGENFHEIDHAVSQEVLLSNIKPLPSLLERLYEDKKDHRAREIMNSVGDIVYHDREDPEVTELEEDFVLLLLQAVLQASLQILMHTDRDAIGTTYRRTVDIIRDMFEEFEENDSIRVLKKMGVKLVKEIVTAITKSDRKSALLKAQKFLQKYSNKRTARSLQDQVVILERDLKPLKICENFLRSTPNASDAQNEKCRMRHRASNDIPDFFSDKSEETSDVTQDDGTPEKRGRRYQRRIVAESPAAEVESPSATGTPRPPKKRSRMSREVVDPANDSAGVGNEDFPTRAETPVSKSRRRRYPQIGQVLNGMNSPMFSDTRPVSERVDHVVRHARSRGQKRMWRPRENRKHHMDRQQSPTSVSQEDASPVHRGKGASEVADSPDQNEYVRRGIDKDDEDAMDRMGREGAALHDLFTQATKLQTIGPSDPLAESIRDARTAKHRSRESDPPYSPGPDAHPASPFPDSDDDSDMSRKRVTRVQLSKSPGGHHSKKERRRQTGPRPVVQMFGKTCRTGRFEPLEDKQLLKGLSALGWGAWTEIAREFWEGEYTRAPGSLKDRARTLGIDPSMYPRKMELRGRPRIADNLTSNGGPLLSKVGLSPTPSAQDGEDHDADEDDPIEAPDDTPRSRNEDEGS